MKRRLTILLCWLLGGWATVHAAADPVAAAYAAWSQGRPAEAVPYLLQEAQATGRWDRYFDVGLAAAAADRPGIAVAALLAAHRQRPTRSEPLAALRHLGASVPATPTERLGPLAWPGSGWWGACLALLAGGLLGYGLLTPSPHRWRCRIGGALLLVVVAPGLVAALLAAPERWAAVRVETHLVDATGRAVPGGALLPGTLVERLDRPAWAGRVLVLLPDDGPRGWVPLADLGLPVPTADDAPAEPATALGRPPAAAALAEQR